MYFLFSSKITLLFEMKGYMFVPSLIFYCHKHNPRIRTSGVINTTEKERRWCPACSSPMIFCSQCGYVSGTIVDSGADAKVRCDSCNNIIGQIGLRPKCSQSTINQPPVSGVPIRGIDVRCRLTITFPDGKKERFVC